ncbi:hypothetical protein FKW77_003787 [Venturia effusa]|uniref:Uncharacterized protein n=1 Tax=Venturia effusa TaxID=50376 RepID=A0A517LPW9_9PEZI|nr:hypothetical protein FKW77_003787 [Venturia effusa]
MALMVPLQTQFLEVPAPDDDMEISSDAGRVETDNDIDLLDGDDDIDYMLEDTHSEQGQSRFDEMPDAQRDDLMYDDDLDEITYAEEDMHEDVPVPDEHLTDVSEVVEDAVLVKSTQPLDDKDQTVSPPTDPASFAKSDDQRVSEIDAVVETVDTVEGNLKEEPDLEKEGTPEQGQQTMQNPVNDSVTSPDKTSAEDVSPPAGQPPSTSGDGLKGSFAESKDASQPLESTNPTSHDDDEADVLNDEESAPAPLIPLASPMAARLSTVSTSPQEEGTDLPKSNDAQNEAAESVLQHSDGKEEVAGLREAGPPRSFHTTVVDYEGAHISLFPPMEEDEADTFLLSDISLADKTLVDLFRACRQVLGDSINDSLELEIYCEDLDLTISEDSTDCLTTSFSQVVDVYVTLSQQDGVDRPEPFSIILAKKPRWNSRLTVLYQAAAESKGLSAVQADQYLDDHAEADDDYEEDDSNGYEKGPTQAGTNLEVETIEENEGAPAQSSTESRFEDAAEETIGESAEAQDTTATTITDTEPAKNETYHSEDRSDEETAREDNDNVPENQAEGNDTAAQADNNTLELVEQDIREPEPVVEFEASAGVDSLDQLGDLVHEGSPENFPPAAGVEEPNFLDPFSDVNAGDQAVTLGDDGEWPEIDDEAHADAFYQHEPLNQEGYYEDPEAVSQDWNQVHHEDTQFFADVEREEIPVMDETVEQISDREWAAFDQELSLEVGAEEHHVEEVTVSLPEQSTSSGTFRVPDDSAGEEDEDSITYDDDDDDDSEQPREAKRETLQTGSSSQSPLGKRIRDNDDSDQESKRLRSQ